MRIILSIILILASVLGIVLYVAPEYKSVQALQETRESYNVVLDNARKLQAARDEILAKYDAISRDDLTRLSKLVPSNADNVRLALELEALARAQGLTFQNVVVPEPGREQNQRTPTTPVEEYKTLTMNIVLSGPYTGFVQFVRQVEKSLRRVDITGIEFTAVDDRANYQYRVELKTYWVE